MRTTYYLQLDQNPQLRLRWFKPMIRRALESGQPVRLKSPVSIPGVGYTLSLRPEVRVERNQIALYLRWEDCGERYFQRIDILRQRSNLIAGSSVYYFFCQGYRSRKLFYLCGQFRSRRSFRHVYPEQMESHGDRAISYREEPYRKYGKPVYRGKLTPYGKKCDKYEQNEEARAAAMYAHLGRVLHKHQIL